MKILLFLICFSLLSGQTVYAQTKEISDGHNTITYSNIKEAEDKILGISQCIQYSLLTELILNDDRAMDYDFDLTVEYAALEPMVRTSLEITDSPDGKIRCYSWDNSGYVETRYSSILSLRTSPGVKSFIMTRYRQTQPNDEMAIAAMGVKWIHQVVDNKNNVVYLLYSTHRDDNHLITHRLSAFRLVNNRLELAKVFHDGNIMTNTIQCSCLLRVAKVGIGAYRDEVRISEMETKVKDGIAIQVPTGKVKGYRWNGQEYTYAGTLSRKK